MVTLYYMLRYREIPSCNRAGGSRGPTTTLPDVQAGRSRGSTRSLGQRRPRSSIARATDDLDATFPNVRAMLDQPRQVFADVPRSRSIDRGLCQSLTPRPQLSHVDDGPRYALLADARAAVRSTSIRSNRRSDGLYHATTSASRVRSGRERNVGRLPMLEGQVAALSSGAFDAAEAIDVARRAAVRPSDRSIRPIRTASCSIRTRRYLELRGQEPHCRPASQRRASRLLSQAHGRRGPERL